MSYDITCPLNSQHNHYQFPYLMEYNFIGTDHFLQLMTAVIDLGHYTTGSF